MENVLNPVIGLAQKCSSNKSMHYVACEHCTMHPICKSVKTAEKPLPLHHNYLNKRISIKSGDNLFKQNTPLTAFYAVCTGSFKLQQRNNNSQENIVGFRFSGELIGEDALYPKQYNYDAIAVENSAVCSVNITSLWSCTETVPALKSQLVLLLNQQIYNNYQEFNSLIAKKSAESLIAAFLLNVFHRTHTNEEAKNNEKDNNYIYLAMNRDNIANFLGLRRETLSRLFSKFQKEDKIMLKGKKIYLNKNKLKLTANL